MEDLLAQALGGSGIHTHRGPPAGVRASGSRRRSHFGPTPPQQDRVSRGDLRGWGEVSDEGEGPGAGRGQ